MIGFEMTLAPNPNGIAVGLARANWIGLVRFPNSKNADAPFLNPLTFQFGFFRCCRWKEKAAVDIRLIVIVLSWTVVNVSILHAERYMVMCVVFMVTMVSFRNVQCHEFVKRIGSFMPHMLSSTHLEEWGENCLEVKTQITTPGARSSHPAITPRPR
jgi:hypothetical protein